MFYTTNHYKRRKPLNQVYKPDCRVFMKEHKTRILVDTTRKRVSLIKGHKLISCLIQRLKNKTKKKKTGKKTGKTFKYTQNQVWKLKREKTGWHLF